MLLLLAGLALVGTLLPATKPPELVPALVYLVLIGLVTYVGGRRAGIIALVACAVAFDYLFVPPFHHLHPIGSGEGATAPDIETLVAFVVVGLAEVELRARARAETHRARLLGNQMIVLASVSERLSASFDYERTLDEVARPSAMAFDGFCIIDLIDDDGTVRRVATAGTDAYVLARTLPTILYDLLVGTVSTAAFVPVFVQHARDERQLWRLVAAIFSLAGLAFVTLAVVLAAFADPLVGVIGSGFSSPDQRALAANLMRIALVSVVFQGLAGVLTSALYAQNRFHIAPLVALRAVGQIDDGLDA